MALTAKQQAFINEYLIDFNATQAAIRAGYSERSAGVIGHQNLKKLNISEEIQRRIDEKTISADEVLVLLSEHARGNIADFLEFKSGIRAPYLNIQQGADRGKLRLVKKFKYNSEGQAEIELYDAQSALVQLAKIRGLFTEHIDVTSGGQPVKGYAIFSPDDWDDDTEGGGETTE